MTTTKTKKAKPMLAYHSDQAIKRKYMARVRAHRKADELCAGVGFHKNGKVQACAVGCTFDKYDHSRGPVEIGVPETLMHLEDAIFEGLSRIDRSAEHLDFPEAFLGAIKPGADLMMVWPKFALWLLSDADSVIPLADREHPTVKTAIDGVAGLYREWIDSGIKPSEARFSEAACAAGAAWAAGAAGAAWAAGAACAAGAARAACAACAAGAAWAAEAARAACAAGAAGAAGAWRSMRDKLLSLLKAAK